ncbi:AMP-binding protein [Aquihabitans daechungensis]|uniref:AMP-binding protein n=1 Tax=Aquihabitans daechungensis TaxID=1052257 RepID=UPI003BA3A8FE
MTALLRDIVAVRGDEPAIIDERGTTSWNELDDRVTRLVHALEGRGLRAGDTVVAMLGNQVEMIEATLACVHGGWLFVPLNWHWVAREVAYVLADADTAAVIVDERWADVMTQALIEANAPRLRCRLLAGDAPLPSGFERYDDAVASASGDELVDPQRGGPMFYTSGTTGWPKGVRSALSAIGGPPEVLLLIAHTMAPTIGVTPGDRIVQLVCGPLYHSAQWAFGVFSLCCGATVVLQHRFDAAEVLQAIDQHGVTNMHLVPTQMIRLLELPDDVREAFDGSSLVQIIHGAAPCAPSVKRRMIEWVGPVVSEYYGGTEGGFISLISAEEWLAKPGSVGRPLTVVEVLILGPDGEPLGPGETGEVWFRSLLGSDFEYHNAPEKTASAHRNGGLGTLGDVGSIDEDGYLFLSDRKIDMIVSGGVNVYPAEIEAVLTDHRAVADAAVFGIPDDEMGESVHAALTLRHGHVWSDALAGDLRAFCRERLAGYKVPRTFEVHDELPRSEAGKLSKRTLRDPWWIGRDRAI